MRAHLSHPRSLTGLSDDPTQTQEQHDTPNVQETSHENAFDPAELQLAVRESFGIDVGRQCLCLERGGKSCSVSQSHAAESFVSTADVNRMQIEFTLARTLFCVARFICIEVQHRQRTHFCRNFREGIINL